MSQRTPSQRSAIDADHGRRRGAAAAGARGVELQHLRPGREVRVAPAGDDGVADGEEAVGVGGEVLGRAAHEVLGVLDRPAGGRAPRGWARSRASAPTPRSASSARAAARPGVAAEVGVDRVVADAVGGADDVVVGDVGQRRRAGRPPSPGCVAGDRRAGRAALPHPHQPHGVDARPGDVVPHVGRARRPASPAGRPRVRQLVEPHPREDLVDERVGGQPHAGAPLAPRGPSVDVGDAPGR